MPIEKAVEMTIKILDGLEFLHSRNIIHRDLKPANILLQGETPRLADFGISRALRTTASSQSSNVSGTFAYMPPEGFDGKRSVQTDVWSVGVNLYQFLTGTLPFPNKEPSALIAAIMMREFEPLPADVPQNLQNVIAKALAKQPENRYASANEMREDLRRVMRGEAVSNYIQPDSRQNFSASETPPTQKVAPNFAQNSQDENETVVRSAPSFGQSEKHKTSNVWMYATLVLVLVGTIGLGIYFLIHQSKQTYSSSNEMIPATDINATNNSSTQLTTANSTADSGNVISNNIESAIATPTLTPTPEEIKETMVRLRFIDVARACGGTNGGIVSLKTQNKSFSATTNRKGFAVFNKIPCGESVKISLQFCPSCPNSEYEIRQTIKCSKSVYLGSFNSFYGDKVSESEANFCSNNGLN
jgi:serine/threonine protein kinase